MQFFDNITHRVVDDLREVITASSKLSIAAACFSIYAYQALKKQLEQIEELRFIFTSPTFVAEKAEKQKREFYIPQRGRERSLYGTEFEIKLRNELTQKTIAKECADWIRRKVQFRSNTTGGMITSMIDVNSGADGASYSPVEQFTTSGLGCERGNNIAVAVMKTEHAFGKMYLQMFNNVWHNTDLMQDVTEEVLDSITAAYKENTPEFIYFTAIYTIFNEFLEDISEDVLPNEATGFKQSAIWRKLYDFQRDAALAVINKLEKFNGCILADSVGLGKTFTALAVIKYYELRNRNVLVLCPKKLSDNWQTFKQNYLNNPVADDRLRYDVLFHTDLSRDGGMSGGIDLSKLNWSNYDLVVIDESHNFRNGGAYSGADDERRENRYLTLLNKVIRQGIRTKVLMLSATPVNNGFSDLRHQLALAYEGDAKNINETLNTEKPIDVIFRQAQAAFNRWSDRPAESRTTDGLLRSLSFDFFTLLDSVTIARSRKHIELYYNMAEIGSFPTRLPPISLRPSLTELPGAVNYAQIYEELMRLNLSVYSPMVFVHPSKVGKYTTANVGDSLRITGRESGIRRLMAVNLLKRLESSVDSFRLTLQRMNNHLTETLSQIDTYRGGGAAIDTTEITENDVDLDDANTDFFGYGKERRIDLADMDYVSWRKELSADKEILELMLLMIDDITPEHDLKLQTLLRCIADKLCQPVNTGNKKILIFSAFSDTAEYLYREVAPAVKARYGLETAMVTGSTDGKTTVKLRRTDMNTILTLFSPLSKDKGLLLPDVRAEIDILIATDCISEGQNLQDCDCCINYDIHWNPVRIIQRFGRIDRIGSRNDRIQLINFWPDVDLDEYLSLKGRVETRMKASIMVATGDDNPIDPEERGDLEYRKAQLERLQTEVVDIEEMQSGISIMDLGLNEFRLDLLEYMKRNEDMDKVPFGLHAVVKAAPGAPPGTLFVLKNRHAAAEVRDRNQLHPFYLVYMTADGETYMDHLQPKKLLDVFRLLCKGKTEPESALCRAFNKETRDGKDMRRISALLTGAIGSIIEVKEESDIDSLFSPGGTSALQGSIKGLDDFELICFLCVREG